MPDLVPEETQKEERDRIDQRLIDIQFAESGCDIEEVKCLHARRAALDAAARVRNEGAGGA